MKTLIVLITMVLLTGCAVQHTLTEQDRKPNIFGLKALELTYTDGPKSMLGGFLSSDGFLLYDDDIQAQISEKVSFLDSRLNSGTVPSDQPLIDLCNKNSYKLLKSEDYTFCINGTKVEFRNELSRKLTHQKYWPGYGTIFAYDYSFETLVPYENETSKELQETYEEAIKGRDRIVGSFVRQKFEQESKKDKLRNYISQFKLVNKISLGQKLCRFTEDGGV